MSGKPDGRRRPISDADVARLRDMRASGASDRAIGLAFGLSPRGASEMCRRAGVPPGCGKCPGNDRENDWTDAERAIVIAGGFDLTADGLMRRLPGRSERAVLAMRKRLERKGLIVKPEKIAGHSRKMRSKSQAERAPKPPRVKAEPKSRKPRVRVAKVKRTKSTPIRAVAPPLPPEPVVRELPPNIVDVPLWRPLPVIKRMAMADQVVMTDANDLQRYNKRRAEMGKQPVFIPPGSLDARF